MLGVTMTEPPSHDSLFEGHSVRVTHEGRSLVLRPAKGNRFWSPPATTILSLPASRILDVRAEPIGHPGWVSLRFHGDFGEGLFPDVVDLAPIGEIDARLLIPLLSKRLGLPRRPKAVHPYDLVATPHREIAWDTFLTVVGTQMPAGHFEGPDFEGVRLEGDDALLSGRVPGKRYQVTGFYQPGFRGDGPRPVGYSGASIRVRSIRPEPDGRRRDGDLSWFPPPSPDTRGPVTAFLQPTENHGYEQLAFSTRPDPTTRIVALIDAQGGQRTGSFGARLAQVTLATLLGEPAYDPLLGPTIEPPARVLDDLPAWAAWLCDRTPLPMEPPALVTALGNRIGEVLEGANLRGCALTAFGILAVIRGGRATILRRGTARAYVLRGGTLYPLVHEHVLGREAEVAARPDLAAQMADHFWVPVSLFDPVDPEAATPPLELDVYPGDRLLFVAGRELLQALEDPARERLLTQPVPDITAGMPPTQAMIEGGWGVVAVDIGADPPG